MRKIRRRYNYKPGKQNETPKGVSVTIPGETYTIRELLKKHTRGILPPDIIRQGQYSDEQEFDSPDLQKLHRSDINDKTAQINELKKTQKILEQEHQNKIKQHKKAIKEKAPSSKENYEANNKEESADASTKEKAKKDETKN